MNLAELFNRFASKYDTCRNQEKGEHRRVHNTYVPDRRPYSHL